MVVEEEIVIVLLPPAHCIIAPTHPIRYRVDTVTVMVEFVVWKLAVGVTSTVAPVMPASARRWFNRHRVVLHDGVPGAFPGCIRQRLLDVPATPELDDPRDQQKQHRQDQGELGEGLSLPPPEMAHRQAHSFTPCPNHHIKVPAAIGTA
jgi:hypothetical protein